MRQIFVVLGVTVAACGGGDSSDVPSCQEAMEHFYGAGCVYENFDGSGSAVPVPLGTEITACETSYRQAAGFEHDDCTDALDAWVECSDSVPDGATTNAQCDCTRELMAIQDCRR